MRSDRGSPSGGTWLSSAILGEGVTRTSPDTDDHAEIAFYWVQSYCEWRGYTYYSTSQIAKPTITKLAECGWSFRWRVPSIIDPNLRAPMPREDPLAHDPIARAARRICIDDTLVKSPEELLQAAEQEVRRGGFDSPDLPASKEELYEHLVKIASALQSRYMFLDEWKWRERGHEWCRPGYIWTEYWERAGTRQVLWAFPTFRVRRRELARVPGGCGRRSRSWIRWPSSSPIRWSTGAQGRSHRVARSH